MKNTLKKIMSAFLAGVSLFSLSTAVSAEEPITYRTGLLDAGFEAMVKMYDENNEKLYIYRDYRKGDLNENGKIEAADARQCLRVAAKLEELVYKKRLAADVDNDNVITSKDTRLILRAAAGIEEIETKKYTDFPNCTNSISLKSSGKYFWRCIVDGEDVNLKEYRINNAPGEVDGAPIDQFFVFAAKREGVFTVKFILANSSGTDIIDEFEVILDC